MEAGNNSPDGDESARVQLDRRYVQAFKPLVAFLGQVCGPLTEIALHDASRPDSSIVAIANGQVSGRTVGSPATDLMLRILGRGKAENRDYIAGYAGHAANSDIPLLSSTYFIRRQGRIVGMLCINRDQSALAALSRAVVDVRDSYFPSSPAGAEALRSALAGGIPSMSVQPAASADPSLVEPLPGSGHQAGADDEEENLSLTVDDMAQRVVKEAVSSTGRKPGDFSLEERMAVIRDLHTAGYFLLKGSIASIASLLDVAESTIYRYLQQVRKG
ncbi:helix-turn-helix transcriptional regulator [Bifidobacterium xylocopae]|uniref:Transcriptional regulator n=1 Tax=Bifidobacterium xylocopae TaxID=2493119 RepID=A0A366KE04_9BIFI|nr:transcriptional regulator [Bifidobacterium xylocopae]RBP99343.1 hypothetical protein CRD59_03830 [Bifidobacterium xylocopae]